MSRTKKSWSSSLELVMTMTGSGRINLFYPFGRNGMCSMLFALYLFGKIFFVNFTFNGLHHGLYCKKNEITIKKRINNFMI